MNTSAAEDRARQAVASVLLRLLCDLPDLHKAPVELAQFLEVADKLSDAVDSGPVRARAVSEGMNQVLLHLIRSCISKDWQLAPRTPSGGMLVAGAEACGLGCDIAHHTYERMSAQITSAPRIDVGPLAQFVASVAAANRILADAPEDAQIEAPRPE